MLAVLSAALGTVVIACWQLSERSAHRGGYAAPGGGADLFQSLTLALRLPPKKKRDKRPAIL